MSPLNSSTIKFTLCLHDLTILKSNLFTIIMTMKRYSRANKLKFEEFRKKGKKKKKTVSTCMMELTSDEDRLTDERKDFVGRIDHPLLDSYNGK